jgi:hypothetical protein
MNTVSHLAGPWVDFGGRIIQRCVVCGEKLCDNKNTAQPLNADGSVPTFPTFERGHFIQVSVGENPRRLVDIGESEKIPPDSCIALVED